MRVGSHHCHCPGRLRSCKHVTAVCLPFFPFPNGNANCGKYVPVPSCCTGSVCGEWRSHSSLVTSGPGSDYWPSPRNPRLQGWCICRMGFWVVFLMEELHVLYVEKRGTGQNVSETVLLPTPCPCVSLHFPAPCRGLGACTSYNNGLPGWSMVHTTLGINSSCSLVEIMEPENFSRLGPGSLLERNTMKNRQTCSNLYEREN